MHNLKIIHFMFYVTNIQEDILVLPQIESLSIFCSFMEQCLYLLKVLYYSQQN